MEDKLNKLNSVPLDQLNDKFFEQCKVKKNTQFEKNCLDLSKIFLKNVINLFLFLLTGHSNWINGIKAEDFAIATFYSLLKSSWSMQKMGWNFQESSSKFLFNFNKHPGRKLWNNLYHFARLIISLKYFLFIYFFVAFFSCFCFVMNTMYYYLLWHKFSNHW